MIKSKNSHPSVDSKAFWTGEYRMQIKKNQQSAKTLVL